MADFDVQAARNAGYSDDEILSHLTQTRKFDVDGAVKSGYSKGDIINHLSSTPTAAPAAGGPKRQPTQTDIRGYMDANPGMTERSARLKFDTDGPPAPSQSVNPVMHALGAAWDAGVGLVKGAAKTYGHAAQAVTGDVGPIVQDIGDAAAGSADQVKKSQDAWKRSNLPGNRNPIANRVEAVGHAAAAALPLVGPAAAHVGERAGGEYEYDPQGNVNGVINKPDVSGAVGEGATLLAASTPKSVAGPILSRAGRVVATAADRLGVPEALERSAGVSYRKMLTPTAKGVVTEAEQIAGGPSPNGPTGLVKNRPVALTRKGMMQQAQAGMDEVGPRTATIYNDKPPLDPKPILDHLEEIRQQKAVVKGTKVVSDPALNDAIDELKQNIEDMRGEDGKVAAVSLDDFKDKLNRGNVSPKGHMRLLAPQTAASIEKSVAGRIGGYLDTTYPDAAEVNAAYRTAKHTHNFLEEQRQAEIAAQSGVRTGSSSGFGAALKKAIPAPLRGIPNAIAAITDSVAWDSVSGATKAKIAELIRNGAWEKKVAPMLKAAHAQTPLTKQSLEDLIRTYTDNTVEREQPPAGPDWWKNAPTSDVEAHAIRGRSLSGVFTDNGLAESASRAGANVPYSEWWKGQPPTHAETVQRYRELFDEARARDTQKAPLSGVMDRFGVPTKDTPGMHIPRAGADWWKDQPDYAALFDQADKIAARRARTAPTVPESGVPENVARMVDARDRMSRSLTGKTWDTASASERNVIDQMIAEGHGKSVQPVPKFAKGGIIRRPTLGIVGEAGPEKIVAVEKLNRTPAGRATLRSLPSPDPIERTSAKATVPERPESLRMQLHQLGAGARKMVMFPRETPLMKRPAGMKAYIDLDKNTYLYNPALTSQKEIDRAIQGNSLTDLLGPTDGGMGVPDKSLMSADLNVIAKEENGSPIQSAASDRKHLKRAIRQAKKITPPGGKVSIESPDKEIARRQSA